MIVIRMKHLHSFFFPTSYRSVLFFLEVPEMTETTKPEKHLSQEGLMETVGFEKAHFRMP